MERLSGAQQLWTRGYLRQLRKPRTATDEEILWWCGACMWRADRLRPPDNRRVQGCEGAHGTVARAVQVPWGTERGHESGTYRQQIHHRRRTLEAMEECWCHTCEACTAATRRRYTDSRSTEKADWSQRTTHAAIGGSRTCGNNPLRLTATRGQPVDCLRSVPAILFKPSAQDVRLRIVWLDSAR